MSVAKYYPFNGQRGRLRLGLNQIEFSEWLQYEVDFTDRVKEKKFLIRTEGTRVLDTLPNSIEAQKEYLDLLLKHIKQYHSDLFEVFSNHIFSKTDKISYAYSNYQTCPLELASYLIGDDICLLNEIDGDYRLVAASVCAPTWWDLPEKIGKPLTTIHAPIANLEEKIGRMIRHFLQNLNVNDCYQRSNWFLFTSPELCIFPNSFDFYAEMSEIDLENIETKLYLRSERQTFRRLENSNHIAFGIKVYVEPINIVKKYSAIAKDLMIALETMNDEQKNGLGIGFIEKPLKAYLQNVLQV